MNKVLVFDFDGTICHSFNLVNDGILHALSICSDTKLTQEEIFKAYGPSEDGILNNLVDKDKERLAFNEYLKFYNEKHDKYFNDFIPGIRELLETLKKEGFTIYLLTGRSNESLMISLTKLNAFQYFDDLYYGSSKGMIKDELLLKLMKDHNLNSNDLLYVGDTLKDVIQCHKVGVDVISVIYDNDKSKDKIYELNKEKVAKNVSDLEMLIRKYGVFNK